MSEKSEPLNKRIPVKKHRLFIDELFKCNMKQVQAYQNVYRCDYDTARVNASRLLTNANIQEEIERRLNEKAMSADEVLARLADQARGSLGDFTDVKTMSDLESHPLAHLVKKLKVRARKLKDGTVLGTMEIELHDPQSALVHLGKYHGLFTDKIEHTGTINLDDSINNALKKIYGDNDNSDEGTE